MPEKPSYEEMERRVLELENAESDCNKTEAAPRESKEKYRRMIE